MQAHALTPRMVDALTPDEKYDASNEHPPPNDDSIKANRSACTPDLPFLSVLASGGHTLLIHSASLTDHRVLGTTSDIAIGECLDKVARVVLPSKILQTTKSTMYGALLEAFALPAQYMERPTLVAEKKVGTELRISDVAKSPALDSASPVHSAESYLNMYGAQYNWYEVPLNHEDAMQKSTTKWGWSLPRPLTTSGGGVKIKTLEMSFSGITTMVERIMKFGSDLTTMKLNKFERAAADVRIEERKDLARETMIVAFEHVASRVVLGLQSLQNDTTAKPAVVMAGGVASNLFFRHMQVTRYVQSIHANPVADSRVLCAPMDILTSSYIPHHPNTARTTQP
jgi:N6-L-threonylcarbamoyladenine synthase